MLRREGSSAQCSGADGRRASTRRRSGSSGRSGTPLLLARTASYGRVAGRFVQRVMEATFIQLET